MEYDTVAKEARETNNQKALFKAVTEIADYNLRYLLSQNNKVKLNPCEFKRVVYDATIIFYEEYLLKPEKPINKYYPVNMYSVKTALWGRPRGRHSRKYEQNTICMTKAHECIEYHTEEKENPRDYLKDILTDHANGDYIVYTLYKARSYKSAILKIEKLTGKRWLYDRAVKLKYVYDILHVRKP